MASLGRTAEQRTMEVLLRVATVQEETKMFERRGRQREGGS
jgi:hypothetical protein